MTWNNFDRYTIAQLCERYGPLLKLPAGDPLDPQLVLWALSGNESSFGANCKPRFEPAYFSGLYSKSNIMQDLIAQYGEDAAKSYGPWQVMLINAPGFSPTELAQDAERAITATVGFLNRRVFSQMGSHAPGTTLEQIGRDFNHGNYWDGYQGRDVEEYVANLQKHYDEPMILGATGGVIHS